MTPADRLLTLAASQHGVLTRRQARSVGLSFRAVDHLVRSGRWEFVTDEVLRLRGSPRTDAQALCEAVLDAGHGTALSHLTAAAWWGVTGCPLRPLHVVRCGPPLRGTSLARVHRVRALPLAHVTVLRGVPTVRPEQLALQLFAVCHPGRADRLVDRMWSMRLLSGPSLAAFVGTHGRRGRNGTAGLRRYLDRRGPDYVPPASGIEARFMELMERAGIPMRRQVDSGGSTHWTGRVDFRHEHLPVVVEIQSEAYHTALSDREADAARIADLRDAGFEVLEITDRMLFASPAEVVRQVRDAIRRL